MKRCGSPCSRKNQRHLKRRQTKPLHRSFRASPHSHGGASYAVTHSRRKYHHPPACLLARSLAWGCVTALVSVAPFPIAEISWRTRRPAPHAGNVFDGPIQFSPDSSSSVPLLLPGKILKLKFFTYIRQRFSKQIFIPLFSQSRLENRSRVGTYFFGRDKEKRRGQYDRSATQIVICGKLYLRQFTTRLVKSKSSPNRSHSYH